MTVHDRSRLKVRTQRIRYLICAVTLILGIATPVHAKEVSYISGALRKLGRGFTNVITGPVEILRVWNQIDRESEGVIPGLLIAPLYGTWLTLKREVVGVYEISTFPFPLPSEFQPILLPEFILGKEGWGSREDDPLHHNPTFLEQIPDHKEATQ